MKRTVFASGLAALLAAGTLAARAPEGGLKVKAEDVHPIVAKALEAGGGADNIEKFKASVSKFKGKFHGQGLEADMTGTQFMAPHRQKVEAALDASGNAISYLRIIDGDKGWQSINGNPEELSKDQLEDFHQNMFADRLASLHAFTHKDLKVTPAGESKVEGKDAVGVKASAKGHGDVTVYFDKATGHVLKTSFKGKDPMSGDDYTQDTLYGNYKKAGSLVVPHKIEIKRDGKPFMEMELTTVTVEPSIPDKEFAKP